MLPRARVVWLAFCGAWGSALSASAQPSGPVPEGPAATADSAEARPAEAEAAPAPAPPSAAEAPREPSTAPPALGWAPTDAAPTRASSEPPAQASAGVEPELAPPDAATEVDAISSFAVYYNVAIPFGGTRDFTNRFSWWGFSFDFRQRLVDKVTLGVSFEWQGFDQTTRSTATLGAVTVTGTQVREETSFPLLAIGHYYLRDVPDGLLPFVGGGIGAYRINRSLDVGPTVRFTDAEWHFGFAPEVGVSLPSSTGALIVRSRFHIALGNDEVPGQMYWSFSLGGAL